MTTTLALIATYDVRLVALSVVIALFGSYIALDLAGQIASAQGWAKKLWLIGGAVCLGMSIWAMHFIAMLAYQLPIPAVYDLTVVFVSMAIAITGAGAGLFIVTNKQPLQRLSLLAGALFVGLGIVGLHLTAMASMRVAAVPVYSPQLMMLAATTAVACSGGALWLEFHPWTIQAIASSIRKISSTFLLATAIVGMHYTAMTAVNFQPNAQIEAPDTFFNRGNPRTEVPSQVSSEVNNGQLALLVGVATLIILILTLLASFFGQQSIAKLAKLEAQRQSEARFRALVQNAFDIIVIIAADCTISYLSPSASRILGLEPEQEVGKNASELLHPDDVCKAQQLHAQLQNTPNVNITTELRLKHINGNWRDFEVILNNLLAEADIAGIVATCRDISDRKAQQQQLYMLERAIDQSIDGIAVSDLEGKILFINPAWAQMHRCNQTEVIGQHISIFHTEEQMQQEVLPFMETLQRLGADSGEIGHKRFDGTLFPAQKAVAVLKDGTGEPIGYTAIARDITERKRAEAQLREYAFHDTLTKLPNRTLFMERLEYALHKIERDRDYLFAVLFLDLDRFKIINDSLGHSYGDQLLVAIAHRIKSCLRPTDTAARLGGDEFTILLEDIKNITDATRVADRIQNELKLPFTLGEYEVFTTASIGIALSDSNYNRASDLLRDADIAMYRAKTHGKARYEIFNTEMHAQAMARLQLESDLRRAVERGEFQLYYQPIISLKSGKISSFETLLRWRHPQRGLLLPDEFLSVVEETGLSVALNLWVLRKACQQMQQWQQQFSNNAPLAICVNFCSQLFAQTNLVGQVKTVLEETNLNPQSLKIEITESVILENAASATTLLLELKALGIQLAIDDFGTGYSSLGRLYSFPIDVLKIDRSFIAQADTNLDSLDIFATIVTLAHSLGVDVTAEGIETAQQLARIRELHCEYGQGNYFSLPVDSEAATALIAQQPQW
ncbi:EAL domain-containing protein [Chroococcidiopsis sp. TS-821]|uniref:EAL domain-containing protein n=1 Tax=Chroococcidiopsis sp. TS-821 TaxID=1378066 RepID=UPI000CEF49D4|nr:EAL domain-containing protein [Chroococcidiopsis sp. TS-821]PPS40995.1 hypothetical protein B1A85_18995 [Chroococcidiopsis sp. TS-821]